MKNYLPGNMLASIALLFTIQFLNGQAIHPVPNTGVEYKERNVSVTSHKTKGMDEATLRKKMKADGLVDPVIDKLIAQRKLWEKNGTYTWTSVKNNNQNPIINAPCNGLGVENGWGAWQWQKGSNSGANPAVWTGAPANNPATPDFTIMSGAGNDPNTPGPAGPPTDPVVPVVCPGFGNSSIKIGDDCNVGSVCQQLTYPLTVTAQDTNFVFAYAVVLEDAGHLPSEQPFCQIVIYDQAGNPINCVPLIYTGGPSIPGFHYVSGTGCAFGGVDQYKPWTLVGVNLNSPVNYVGQNLTVVITNCDCIYGGHFVYSYWDFLCATTSLSAGCFGNQSSICGPIDPNIAYTYTWYNNGIPIPPPMGTQQCITITPQPGDTITVAVHQPSNCDFHLTYVPASVWPNFNYTGKCGTYTFTDSSYASPSSVTMTNWQWSFPGGTPATSTSQTPTVTYSTPGNYAITLTVTCSAGCTAVVTHTVNVTALPTAAFTSSPPCLGSAVILTDGSISPAGDPITQWSWNMPGGNPVTSTSQNTSTVYNTAGPHTVTLTVTTQSGCTSNIPQQVLVYNPPVANFSGSGAGCAPLCVNNWADLSTSTDGNLTSWQWTFPGGTPSSFSGQTPTQICYNNPGTYGASLIVVSQYGCTASVTITPLVNVYPWPFAEFSVNPLQASATDPNFTFLNLWSPISGTDPVVSWAWDFGDGGTDIVNMAPAHSYSASVNGNDFFNYNICVTVQNSHGCWDSICHSVEILPEYEFYIPNTFTPNDDFHNELFFGKCRGVKDYSIWVFDRWGNIIWDCHVADSNVPWDYQGKDGLSSQCKWNGRNEGVGIDMSGKSNQLQQEDVYVWKVKLVDVFDKKHTYIGHVNIVR